MKTVFALGIAAARFLPAERAHSLALKALSSGYVPRVVEPALTDPRLAVSLFGCQLPNPIGLAAGFDKNAVAVDGLFGLGFGFLEIGGVTLRPQPGNPKPRLFRLPPDRAIINRLGFNNDGCVAVANRLMSWRQAARAQRGVVGVNLGINKDATDAAGDFALAAVRFAPIADFLVINISSPNTPGLRSFQSCDHMLEICGRVRMALNGIECSTADHSPDRSDRSGRLARPPLLVKIAPDLSEEDLADIATAAVAGACDGLVVSNTTITRPDNLRAHNIARQSGGLSGAPLFAMSTQVLRRVRTLTGGQVPLIGVGGVADAATAYQKIRAGASAVQLYTGLVYGGPRLVIDICRGLLARIEADGFPNLAAAVGADAI